MDDGAWVKEVEARFDRLREATHCSVRREGDMSERIALLELQMGLMCRTLLSKGLVDRETVEQCLRLAEGVLEHDVPVASDLPAEPLDTPPLTHLHRWGRGELRRVH